MSLGCKLPQPAQKAVKCSPLFPTPTSSPPPPQTAGYAGQVAGGQREWSAWSCCFSYIFSCSSSDAAACSAFQLLQWLPAAPTLLLPYSCPLSAPVLPQSCPPSIAELSTSFLSPSRRLQFIIFGALLACFALHEKCTTRGCQRSPREPEDCVFIS